jgi:hypothetical protein
MIASLKVSYSCELFPATYIEIFEDPKVILGWELGVFWVLWVLTGLLLGSLGFNWVLTGFIGFIGFLLGYCWVFWVRPIDRWIL